MKLKPKHWRVTNHYARWVDKRWFPNFIVTREVVEAFIKFESQGKTHLSPNQCKLIEPLIGNNDVWLTGKASFELQKKGLHEEIFGFWKRGFGWSYPLAADIICEFKSRHEVKNTTWLKELINIYRQLSNYPRGWQGRWQTSLADGSEFVFGTGTDTVINYLLRLKGSIFNEEEINKILEYKIASLTNVYR